MYTFCGLSHVYNSKSSHCVSSLTNPATSDIRDTAFEVNDRLKKLILPKDDEDTVTDREDESKEALAAAKSSSKQPSAATNADSAKTGGGVASTPTTGAAQSSGGGGGAEPVPRVKQIEMLSADEPKFHLLSVLAVLIPHMKFTQQETRKETLRWIMWLHQHLPKRVRSGGFFAGTPLPI